MKKIYLSIVLLIAGMSLLAQEGGGIVSLNYSVGVTTGSSNEFVSPVSGRGFNFDLRFNVTDNISVGGLVGWNYFHERLERQTFEVTMDDGQKVDVNAVQTRYLNMLPMMFQGQYRFVSGSTNITPYVGLAIGGYRVDYEKFWGDILDEKEQWEFGLSPHAGVLIPFASELSGLNIELKYNWANFSYNEVKAISFFDANAGIYFMF